MEEEQEAVAFAILFFMFRMKQSYVHYRFLVSILSRTIKPSRPAE